MRRILILSLCFLVVVGCGCNNTKNKETEKEEKLPFEVNFDVAKETTVDGLKISDINLIVTEGGISNYSATITNETDNVYKLNQINIIIKNKKGNKIASMIGYIGSDIAPGESRKLNASTDKDLMDGYEIEYEIKK